jgi:hypothetical protein
MGKITKALMLLSAGALIATASPAAAVTGGPPIAYVINIGKTFDVYLGNSDGTGKVKVYSTTTKHSLWQIDVRPGGNQLALVENVNPPSILGTIKIISYSDAGVVSNVTSIAPSDNCQVLGIDYHPTKGSLLVSRYCNKATVIEARSIVNSIYESTPIFSTSNDGNSAAGYIRWLGDGSGFLLSFGHYPDGAGVNRHTLSNPYAPVTVYKTGSLSLPTWFDVARCSGGALDASCSKMLVTAPSGVLHLVTFDDFGGTDQGALYGANSTDGHYSPDNNHILWRQQDRQGYHLMIDNTVFLAKGPTGVKDWRQ